MNEVAGISQVLSGKESIKVEVGMDVTSIVMLCAGLFFTLLLLHFVKTKIQ